MYHICFSLLENIFVCSRPQPRISKIDLTVYSLTCRCLRKILALITYWREIICRKPPKKAGEGLLVAAKIEPDGTLNFSELITLCCIISFI